MRRMPAIDKDDFRVVIMLATMALVAYGASQLVHHSGTFVFGALLLVYFRRSWWGK